MFFDQDITILKRDDWTVDRVLKEGHNDVASIVVWSPNGKYLASVGLEKQVLIWDLSTNETLNYYKHDTFISSISWSFTENALAIVFVFGCPHLKLILFVGLE